MSESKLYFMCPRRREAGSWEQKPDDFWKEDRWEKGEGWKIDFIPRSCSFCGCIHPEDAIKLLELGWEVETTTKRYKRYMHPKGFKNRMRNILKSLREKEGDIGKEDKDDNYWEPIPPVKLYVMHFSDVQTEKFNKVMNSMKDKDTNGS